MPGCDFVVRPLARQQRPRTADPATIVRTPVVVFAVVVTVVPPPDRPKRHLNFQDLVNYANRIENTLIVRGSQPETDQRQRIGADDLTCSGARVRPGPI